MLRIAWSAGHGINTPGKRSPDDEREWSFNSKVVTAAMAYLSKYADVQQLRLDDPSGAADVPLQTRTDRANEWDADLYISCHHNALSGSWGNHGGVETYVMEGTTDKALLGLATAIHKNVVAAMGTRDRGVKTANFQELRETKMHTVLVEGGFMDSTIDIRKMRNDQFLRAQGEGIAKAVVQYFGLVLKSANEPKGGVRYLNPSNDTLKNEFIKRLQRAADEGILSDPKWVALAKEGRLSIDDAICLLAAIDNRRKT